MPKSRLQWEYTEDDMAEAILDITDHGLSPPQAAQRRGVPRTTLIDRLNGRGAAEDQIQPRRRLSKNQEDRLAFWILRQESLGYAPSHSQIRACVMGLLRQQGEHPDLGRNWVIKCINRRADLKIKMGRHQEAKRFDSFTPKAYGWIKPENTVNVDEGGIMTGFGKYSPLLLVGLDSLVVGSADPKRKAFLKGPQTRNWTSFIEAVTADGRALVPGIIFKGKELQKQWFLDEFKQIADWYYITSPNGWTDDHIGIEWLERVYLPQTTPADESDARLIILDGHGSHATDEWMATCFLNNVYCCYLPAHCSHGLQPLYNGVFNALKAAYRRELERFASLTDSAPMDKVNFIRAYAKARRVGMTKKNILSGWRVTGNWPISRAKALRHPEIQQDRPNGSPRVTPEPRPYLGSDDTPQTSRQIRDLGLNKTPKTRRRYNVIAKGFEAHQQTVAAHTQRIASLEEELARLKRGKKRKAVPNPNKRFMTLGETLAGKESIPEGATRYTPVGVEFISSSEQESESEAGLVIEVREENIPHQPTRRSQRIVKKTRVQ
ncbi:transposase [Fusarium oxysporum f. sp. phaseoli]